MADVDDYSIEKMTSHPIGQVVLLSEKVVIVSSSISIRFFTRITDKWTQKLKWHEYEVLNVRGFVFHSPNT